MASRITHSHLDIWSRSRWEGQQQQRCSLLPFAASAAGAFASTPTPLSSLSWLVCVLYHSVPQREHFGKDSFVGAIVPPTPTFLSFGMVGDPDNNNNKDNDNLMMAFQSSNGITSFSPPPLRQRVGGSFRARENGDKSMAWVRQMPPAIYLCNHHQSLFLHQFTVRMRHPTQLRHPPPGTTKDLAIRTMVAPLLLLLLLLLSSRLSTPQLGGHKGRQRWNNTTQD